MTVSYDAPPQMVAPVMAAPNEQDSAYETGSRPQTTPETQDISTDQGPAPENTQQLKEEHEPQMADAVVPATANTEKVAQAEEQAVEQSEPLPESQRPPWEAAPEQAVQPEAVESQEEPTAEALLVTDESLDEEILDEGVQTDTFAEPETLIEAPSAIEKPASVPHKEVSTLPFSVPQDVNDEDEEEDEEEAEERAIADVSDPFNPAADLVQALSAVADEGESEQAVLEVESTAPKAPDTVAQPALGMPLPELSHFSELTMKLWWLVAPRLPLTGLVQNILMNSSLISASEQGVKLEVPLEYGHMLNQTRYEQIQGALSDFFGLSVPLIIDTVEDTSGVTAEEFAASKRAEALQVAIDHLNSHPVVQALASTMGAQLVYDTVKVKA